MEQLSFLYGETLVLSNLSKAACLEMEAGIADNEAKIAAIEAYTLRESCDEAETSRLMYALESSDRLNAAFEKAKAAFIKLVDKVVTFTREIAAKVMAKKSPKPKVMVNIDKKFSPVMDAFKHIIKDVIMLKYFLEKRDFAGVAQYIKKDAPWMKWYFLIVGYNAIRTADKAATTAYNVTRADKITFIPTPMDDLQNAMDNVQDLLKQTDKIKSVLGVLRLSSAVVDVAVLHVRGKSINDALDDAYCEPATVLNTLIYILTGLVAALRNCVVFIGSILLNPYKPIAGFAGGVVGAGAGLISKYGDTYRTMNGVDDVNPTDYTILDFDSDLASYA